MRRPECRGNRALTDGLNESPMPRRQPRLVLLVAALGLLLAAAAVVALALRFVEAERERDLRTWQSRLGIIADTRAAAVNDWLERQLEAVGGLSQNPSLQLYATELALADGNRAGVTDEAAQAGYLRNLLVVTAERTGFAAAPLGPRVGANVPRVGVAGLAVVDAQARVVVATPDMPQLDARLRDFVMAAKPDGRSILDIHAGPGGQPTMAFYTPIVGLQADPGSLPIGGILGIKPVSGELFPLLRRPPTTEQSAESLLIRRAGAAIEFLSPTAETVTPERRIAADTPRLAEAFAAANPGGFALQRDYRDREVLVTGRQIAHVPWTLVHKVDRAEALSESDARLNRLIVLLLLGAALIAIGLIAAWRHGASRRATATADRLKTLSEKLEAQANLLKVVTDSQPAAIFIVDHNEQVRFANRIVAERVGVKSEDLVGKSLASAVGPAEAARHRKLLREVAERRAPVPAVQRLERGRGLEILHIEYVPLASVPGEPAGVLVVEEDITAPITERERRERTQRHLVRTLVALLDRRDPFAADHSQRVAAVAKSVAEEMGLSTVEVETAEIAGSLMNIGKIMVPQQVLTSTSELSADERRQIRQSLQAGAELLDGIEFDGPVVETLRYAQERWAGGGPEGAVGDAIPVTARVIAVANAFVALVSPRAHRPGMSIDDAVRDLLAQSGDAFDRRVVAALINGLENRGGRERWAEFGRPPA
jgi:PAS domain S-box-containing protein